MMKTLIRPALLSGALWLCAPAPAWAHEGHAGDHGWLTGAAQPLLSLDHFLAAVLVVLVGAIGATLLKPGRRPSLR